jgi:quinol monooxygenase YgiN
MYGTIARLQIKPGALEELKRFLKRFEGMESRQMIDGLVGQYLYQMDANPDELYLVVLFRDKASYVANAKSQEQHARYQQMRGLLTADPEWHDGEIVFAQESIAQGL